MHDYVLQWEKVSNMPNFSQRCVCTPHSDSIIFIKKIHITTSLEILQFAAIHGITVYDPIFEY